MRSNGSVCLIWEEDNLMDGWNLVLDKPAFLGKEWTNPFFRGVGLHQNDLTIVDGGR